MTTEQTVRVLFVCLGNICRSPMAEAIFKQQVAEAGLAERFEIASVGTGSWHVGEPPHHGTRAILNRYGISVHDKRARQIARQDLQSYDYVLAMDASNLADVQRMGPVRGELRRMLEFAPGAAPRDVPDPYYTGDFDEVYRLIEASSWALLEHIRERENLVSH
jgi:protein-tyrosine phosphatase